MKWIDLLKIVGNESVFHSGLLQTGSVDPADLGRQLSRWVRSGHLIQLRRGLYVLSEQYRKIQPHPFVVANRLKRASYISLQSALGYYNLIPENVPSVTSVTTGRPEKISTPLGSYIFKHVKKAFFSGYQCLEFENGQSAFIALPEKALLDQIYLTTGSDTNDYLEELRLQNVELLNMERLMDMAERSKSRKLSRAARRLAALLGA